MYKSADFLEAQRKFVMLKLLYLWIGNPISDLQISSLALYELSLFWCCNFRKAQIIHVYFYLIIWFKFRLFISALSIGSISYRWIIKRFTLWDWFYPVPNPISYKIFQGNFKNRNRNLKYKVMNLSEFLILYRSLIRFDLISYIIWANVLYYALDIWESLWYVRGYVSSNLRPRRDWISRISQSSFLGTSNSKILREAHENK